MKIEGLNIHPLKSGRAIPVESATVRLDGLVGDRRFMIVEPDGRFITQRELQALARVEATAVGESLHLEMDGRQIFASFEPEDRLDVTIWDSPVNAAVSASHPRPRAWRRSCFMLTSPRCRSSANGVRLW